MLKQKKCETCSELITEVRVRSPKQLSNLIKKIKTAIKDDNLIVTIKNDDIVSVPFEEVDAEGYWQDIISNQFVCSNCNNKFELFADTYHGSNRNGWYFKGK